MPEPPTFTSLPHGPLHGLRETDDGRSWWEASDFGVIINRQSSLFFHTSSGEKENSNPYFLSLKQDRSTPHKRRPITSPPSQPLKRWEVLVCTSTIHLEASWPQTLCLSTSIEICQLFADREEAWQKGDGKFKIFQFQCRRNTVVNTLQNIINSEFSIAWVVQKNVWVTRRHCCSGAVRKHSRCAYLNSRSPKCILKTHEGGKKELKACIRCSTQHFISNMSCVSHSSMYSFSWK